MRLDFSPLIEPVDVLNGLDQQPWAILDATFTLPTQNRNPQVEFKKAHLPGAQFFDVDVIAAPDTELPHMLPSETQFEQAISRLGIGNETEVVVYDNNQFMASARVWWMFRTFGHEKVRVMNGGLQRWTDLGYPLTSELSTPISAPFSARFNPHRVRDFAAMQMVSESRTAAILDARPPGRFLGQDPEPRPGLRSGHIPGSRNLFFQRLLDPESRCLLKKTALLEVFKTIKIAPEEPIIATCGSGVTAAIIALALAELGYPDTPIYDGSWAEWGQPGDHQVATEEPNFQGSE